MISLRVIASSEGGNFSSRTLCLSLQCKMLVLLLGLMWNSSHLNATVNTVYGLEATDQSLKVVTQQFNDRWPTVNLVNYGVSEDKTVSTCSAQQLWFVWSLGIVVGGWEEITKWEMKTNCGSSLLLLSSFLTL